MMISTKGRYALRVMLDLADHNTGDYIPLKDIAQRQEISVKYLENILASLSRANLVDATRGKGGGYRPDYLNLWFNSMECARRLWSSEKLNSKGLTLKLLSFQHKSLICYLLSKPDSR